MQRYNNDIQHYAHILMDTLTGSVERITFYNPENGYTVVRLRPRH